MKCKCANEYVVTLTIKLLGFMRQIPFGATKKTYVNVKIILKK